MLVPEIDVAQLAEARAGGASVIDVRQPEEWEQARVPGVPLIPLDQLVERIQEVPSSGPVYVICRSGGRSAQAAEYLRSTGRDAINVAGGTLAWMAAGYDTAAGPA